MHFILDLTVSSHFDTVGRHNELHYTPHPVCHLVHGADAEPALLAAFLARAGGRPPRPLGPPCSAAPRPPEPSRPRRSPRRRARRCCCCRARRRCFGGPGGGGGGGGGSRCGAELRAELGAGLGAGGQARAEGGVELDARGGVADLHGPSEAEAAADVQGSTRKVKVKEKCLELINLSKS